MNTNKNIAERLKLVRKSLKLTQKQLADIIGISQGFYANIEKSRYKIDHEHIIQLSNNFNINPTWLLTGEGEMFLDKNNDSMIATGSGINQVKGTNNIVGNSLIKEDKNTEKKFKEFSNIDEKVQEIINLLQEGYYTPKLIDEILDKLRKIKGVTDG
jgi:transcriptional regulator with XRE-family HTH domain